MEFGRFIKAALAGALVLAGGLLVAGVLLVTVNGKAAVAAATISIALCLLVQVIILVAGRRRRRQGRNNNSGRRGKDITEALADEAEDWATGLGSRSASRPSGWPFGGGFFKSGDSGDWWS